MSGTNEYAILVVDDDEPIVKNMRRVLKRKGFDKVISALNAEQGIKLLEDTRNQFFLIISDQRMPGISGSQFLEKSIMLSPESRRMLITGYSDFESIVDAVNKGEIHQYISKPWNNDDLLLRISGELEIYKQFQERKRLFNITNNQNTKLFDIVDGMKKNLTVFTAQLEKKKKEVDELTQALTDAKEQAEYKEVFLGLDELLSRTITMNQKNLAEAFAISRMEVISTLDEIARKNNIPFSQQPGPNTNIDDLGEDIFEIIDQIIENVVQAVEPTLFGIGSESSAGMVIDDYKKLPDFGTLAFNDGYITRGEFEQAQEEMEEKEAEQSTGLTIDKVLISKGFLQRKDLSRLFAKVALIETRLLDREFGKMLTDREIASQKDVDRAFRKQLNYFEDSGVSMLIGDILVESDVIAPELKDEVMANQDRSGGKKSAGDTSSAFSSEFGAFVDLQVSEDRVEAWIRVPKNVHGTTDITPIKQMIKKRGIKNGILADKEIRNFIQNCTDPHEKFTVARGVPASVGNPARIIYHFNTEHDTAGVIREDGSIDFSARGDSPFVKKGQVLAEKKPMEHPKPGVDIFGETLLVGEVEDIPLLGGDGVKFSDDHLQLTATIQGQPSIDAQGMISVLEQFTVNGDVDFKTGNINFNGNVLITGMVKEGFKVECDDLIVNEINGGTILIRGDLKVSNGIVNSYIETQANVQAKFLNNVKIFAHGNIMITREIMGSRILISGALTNDTGRITACLIAARLGFNIKQVGTEKAESSTIKTGVDDHIRWIAEKFEIKIDTLQKDLDLTIDQKHSHDEAHNALHVDVANQTFAQEKLNKKMEFIEKMIGKTTSKEEKQKLVGELKEIETNIEQADERIKTIFESQDAVMNEIQDCDTKIDQFNTQIEDLKKEKERATNRLEKEEPIPIIVVNKKLFRGTKIMGTMASTILQDEIGMSKFMEIDSQNPDNPKQITHQTINL
ncbi:MAG: DUF342 domain-containing protein [Desulfobacteraceae bacterium]|nr:DUF342 domain-containing protein [Desulfobacteraceae bacterium]